jgi:transposase InsO family protein
VRGIVPLVFLALLVSQWVVYRIDTPVDRNSRASNQRWCSDVFLIPCWSGEVVSVAFAIDCHDREVPAYVASPCPLTGADIRTLMARTLWARFGEAMLKAPHAVQWLSDNGPQYTATVLYGHELGLVPITTPAYSPESNGLAEAFVGTFKRDYVSGAELRDAETVLAQLGGWFDDYNTQAPHSALGMRSPAEYRAEYLTLTSSRWAELWGALHARGTVAGRGALHSCPGTPTTPSFITRCSRRIAPTFKSRFPLMM